MTLPTTAALVWVSRREHQFAAHLLETKEEACHIRWLACGTSEWVLKQRVSRKLAPRRLQLPRKLVDDDEEDGVSENGRMTVSEDGEPLFLNEPSGKSNASPIAIMDDSEEEDEVLEDDEEELLHHKMTPAEKILRDDEETGSMSSWSLSSLTQESQDCVTPFDKDVLMQDHVTVVSSSTQASSLPRHVSTSDDAVVSRRQLVSTALQDDVVMSHDERILPTRYSAFSLLGAFGTECTSSTTTSLFSFRYLVQSFRSAMSRRVKYLFPHKSKPTSVNVNDETVGSKRPRVEDTAMSSGKLQQNTSLSVETQTTPSLTKKQRMEETPTEPPRMEEIQTTPHLSKKRVEQTPTEPHRTEEFQGTPPLSKKQRTNETLTVPSLANRQRTQGTPIEPHFTKKQRVDTSPAPEATTLIEEVIRRIALESHESVQEAIDSRVKAGKSLNTYMTIWDVDGSECTTSPMMSWATDRYAEIEDKPFSSDVKKDASDTLKLLLGNNANPYYATKDVGQTPLHAAAAGGYEVALAALLDQVEYSVDQLNVLDSNGETALHVALSNGNYDCFNLFVKKFPAEIILEQVVDQRGENVLMALVRNTDVAYDEDTTCSPSNSKSFALLKRLLAAVKAERRVKPLLHQNKVGMAVMAVAAMCGCFHELKELSKIEFDCGRSIANRCVAVDGELKSPLDLARESKEMIERRASQKEFHDKGIDRIGDCCGDPVRMDNWKESGLVPVIKLLAELEEPLDLQSLRQMSRYREGGRKLSAEQILTEKAQELQSKYAPAAARKVYPPSIRCDLKEWRCLNGSRSHVRAQLLKMARKPFTIPQVTTALIRNPKDPCIRNSTSISAKHYGVFANDFIPKHTVICEYAGLVRREDEGKYDPNPEYGVKLSKCDEWACAEGGKYADAFILDAADVINEGSLINDVRDSILEDENAPEILRTENCMFVEVVINKWPRVFIITLQDIPGGEELLLDYGASYWEKLSLTIMTEKLETAKSRNEELEAEIARLREKLKLQH